MATISSADTNVEGVVLNRHLQLWERWNTDAGGPFGNTFVGHVDLDGIGVVGHSRGGEAVARYAAGLAGSAPAIPVDGTLLFAPALPLVVNGVAPPVPVVSGDLAVTAGSCDGDVGVEGREYVTAPEPAGSAFDRTLLTITGANHVFFNTEWSPSSGRPGTADDAGHLDPPDAACQTGSPSRLDEAEQHRLAETIATTFLLRRVRRPVDGLLAAVPRGRRTRASGRGATLTSAPAELFRGAVEFVVPVRLIGDRSEPRAKRRTR